MQKTKFLLIVDTAIKNKISVALAINNKFYKKVAENKRSDDILMLVDKILKSNKVTFKSINGIIVVSGPGSFTAVRQGVVVANALSFALRVPVVGVHLDEFKNKRSLLLAGGIKLKKVKAGDIVIPFYGKEPNITKPKK